MQDTQELSMDSDQDHTQDPTQPATPRSRNKPGGVLIAYMMEYVPERPGQRAFWAKTKVGAAFSNDDGSFWVELAAIPRSGKLLLRKPIPKEARLETSDQVGAA